ncbi:MAG: hypothetical protein KF914_20770, partial [Rhizobiaceae bacterium]|nr:hypothetical protein [Rhizobiaceae bacterium]
GYWSAEAHWPPAEQARALFGASDDGRLVEGGTLSQPVAVSSRPQTGTASGEWCPYGWGPDMPLDQRAEDAVSVCWDSQPLADALTLLGGCTVELDLDCDSAEAMIAVRLNDVSPDGVSRRITYGLRNLALVDDLSSARPGGARGRHGVTVRLKDVGYQIPAGHRIRVSVSTAYWPVAVGTPARPVVRISSLRLGMPLASLTPPAPVAFGPARVASYAAAKQVVAPGRGRLAISERLDRRETIVEVVRNLGAVELGDVSLELRALGSESYVMPWHEPGQAHSEAKRLAAMRRGDWDLRIETHSRVGFDGPDYRFSARIEAFESDRKIFERQWDERVARPGADRSRAEHSETSTNELAEGYTQ